PCDRLRRFPIPLPPLVCEWDEERFEFVLERRDPALDALQLSPDGDDERTPVLAQCLLVRTLLRGERAPATRRSVCEPSAVWIGQRQRELHVLAPHRELNRRVRVGLDKEDVVRAVLAEHALELVTGAVDL